MKTPLFVSCLVYSILGLLFCSEWTAIPALSRDTMPAIHSHVHVHTRERAGGQAGRRECVRVLGFTFSLES